MWIVALTNAQPLQAVIVNQENIHVGVVCQHAADAWEPLFGVRAQEKFQLPRCFTLSDDAIEALDEFLSIQGL